MSIATMLIKGKTGEYVAKSKEWLSSIPTEVLFLLVSILACSASFGLGMIAEHELGAHADIAFTSIPTTAALGANVASAFATTTSSQTIETQAQKPPTGGKYVASKNGTRYYLPTCSSANRIKPENKIWFPSKSEAEAAGFTPATNCPGL